ncbi:MAG: hypothetical protein RLZZ352_607 [Pseudomonadota bacterium]|jgi:Tfp pilus tip-associated adhesin PilY1
MKIHTIQLCPPKLLAAVLLLISSFSASSAPLTLTNMPLSSATGVDVKPNIMFILDDSLSMELDHLPDWANGETNSDTTITFPAQIWHTRNSRFNGLAYNPAVRYKPPVYYTSDGRLDTTTYPNQTADVNSSWTAVKSNPYTSSATVSLVGNAYFYTTQVGEHCNSSTLKNCTVSSTSSATYPVPAYLRWCNSDAASKAATATTGSCQATQINNQGTTPRFGFPRFPSPRTSTITFSASGSVSGITVGGKQIMSSAASSAVSADELAAAVASSIDACLLAQTGNCTSFGYKAIASGSTLTIYSPKVESTTPLVTSSPSRTATAFTRPANNLAPGENVLTVIDPSVTSYPKGSRRDDCAGSTCTYAEEMTNYANWYAYYRTRMQAMKTSASLAFSSIGEDKKVGLMSINNKTGTSTMGPIYQNINAFGFPHKYNWYTTLFSAPPLGDTPLREALSTAGIIYAGKKTGLFNSRRINDPVEYYCQSNVALLSTDGYWNNNAGSKLDGSAVGDQDGPSATPAVERPQLDGGTPAFRMETVQVQQTTTPQVATQVQQKTELIESQQRQLEKQSLSQLQERTSPLQSRTDTLQTRTASLRTSTSALQTRTRQLQKSVWGTSNYATDLLTQTRTFQIQKRSTSATQTTYALETRTRDLTTQTATLLVNTGTLQQQTASLQERTRSLQQRALQVQTRTSSNGGATWGAWSNVAECSPVSGQRQCQISSTWSGWTNTASCTAVGLPSGISVNPYIENPGTDTQRTVFKTQTECQYTGWTGYSNVASCQAIAASTSSPFSVGTARECTYAAWSTPSNTSSCTPALPSSGSGNWTVSTARQCSYSWTGQVNATAACTPITASSGTGTWSVATARTCGYSAWSTASSTTSCTPVAQDNVNLTARACAYATSFGSWSTVASGACTVRSTESTASPFTGPIRECRYSTTAVGPTTVASCTASTATEIANFTANPNRTCGSGTTAWANASSCTTGSPAGTECQEIALTSWTTTATCTPGTNASGVRTECQQIWGTPYILTTCTPSATRTCSGGWGPWTNATSCSNNGTTEKCQYLAVSAWSNVAAPGTCTVQTASSGTGTWTGPARECQHASWATPTTTTSCTPLARSSGTANGTVWSANPAISCGYSSSITNTGSATPTWGTTTWGAWANVSSGGSCTPQAISSSAPFVATASECQYATGSWTDNASCTVIARSASAPFTVTSARACQYGNWSTWNNVSSCTTVAQSTISGTGPFNGTARQCQTTWSAWTAASSCVDDTNNNCQYASAIWSPTPNGCTVLPASTGTNYTVGLSTDACRTTVISDWANTASCTPGPSGNNLVSCRNVLKPTTGPTPVASCTATSNDGSPEQNIVTCTPNTTVNTPVSTCVPAEPVAPDFTRTTCTETTFGSTADTLADVAQYYYMTDLRTPALGNCTGATGAGTDVCFNDPGMGSAPEKPQRMITYTLGLGASGLMQYDPDYTNPSLTSGDFFSIKTGQTANPTEGICSWQNYGTCNWPKPVNNEQTNIDDLWHAAVNGRGVYYSATDPASLSAGISSALNNINQLEGALASVALTNPNFAAGDNGVFEVSFKVGDWTGDLIKRLLTVSDGNVNLSETPEWSALSLLNARVATLGHADRAIYTFNSTADNKLKAFSWSALNTEERAYFTGPHANSGNTVTGGIRQFCSGSSICLSSADKAAAEGEALVNFLRGDRSNEDTLTDNSKFFRRRTGILGDIIGSEAVFVGKSTWKYADKGHSAFASSTSTRTKMIYVGANDGMLHAFNATTGAEVWAYVPKIVMPNIHKLASKNYNSSTPVERLYSVDGTPTYGDICAGSCNTTPNWKTILVGGLNAGGRGYYALDITDPANPKALWEFTDSNMGYSFGNPIITKLKDGTWVVIVASGYNNISPGDGQGRLFILDASTGELIRSISTGVGTTSAPSGLSKISAWANFPDVNNMTQRVYGGDLEGNVWRFDINGDIPVAASPRVYDAQRLASLKDGFLNPQPVTSRPELGTVDGKPVIFIGTGKLLEISDLTSNAGQSIYAIRDSLLDTDYGNPRSTDSRFVAQTISVTTCPAGNYFCTEGEDIRTTTTRSVDMKTDNGWYADFPIAGERVNTDPKLVMGTLDVRTNRPLSGSCSPAGESFANYFDYRSGKPVASAGVFSGVKLGNFISTTSVPLRLPSGLVKGLIRIDTPGTLIRNVPASNSAGVTRRISWRELIRE